MQRLSFWVLCGMLSIPSFSAQCLSEGQSCVSPYFKGKVCCKGLSCKAVHSGYKCYPQHCVDNTSPCNKDSICCEGSCQESPDQQLYCKPN
jgi:hypothetical protein